jgi:hypothetical protein
MTEKRKTAINRSESAEIMRSEIVFADYNPRRISEDARKTLRKGLKTFGLVGGIVVNKRTNTGKYMLVSGHQRLTEMDAIQGYPGKDYPVRVEVVSLSDKEEKELNILLNNPGAMGEWDSDLLAKLIPTIDPEIAGLTEADLAFLLPPDISDLSPDAGFVDLQTLRMDKGQDSDPARYESEKARLSEEKRKTQEKAQEEALNNQAYICLSFANYARKSEFCARFGIPPMETYISGEDFGEIIERID